MERLRAGVIGVGAIAQIMHLPYLRELDDRFQIAALCSARPGVRYLVVPLIDGATSTAADPLPVPSGLLASLRAQLDLVRPPITAPGFVLFENRAAIPTTASLEGALAEASTTDELDTLVAVDTSSAAATLIGADGTRAADADVPAGVIHLGTPFDERWQLQVGGAPREHHCPLNFRRARDDVGEFRPPFQLATDPSDLTFQRADFEAAAHRSFNPVDGRWFDDDVGSARREGLGPGQEGKMYAFFAAAAVCFALGLASVRERHKRDDNYPPPG